MDVPDHREPQILNSVQLFDMSQGKGVEEGEKSLAFSLIFQHHSRTLNDEEINSIVQQVITNLSTEFNAKIRD